LPGQPPGIWGGAPPWVDNTLPGQPPFPSQGPGFPNNPISGGGYVIGWSPTYGFVFIPLGGANPNPPGAGTPEPEP